MVRKEIACGARQNQVAYVIPKESVPAAGAENENGKTCDDRKNDDHPVLAFEAKKGKVLDQKVQRPAPPFSAQDARLSVPASKIYYFYIFIRQWCRGATLRAG
jgi:hypothetical protein